MKRIQLNIVAIIGFILLLATVSLAADLRISIRSLTVQASVTPSDSQLFLTRLDNAILPFSPLVRNDQVHLVDGTGQDAFSVDNWMVSCDRQAALSINGQLNMAAIEVSDGYLYCTRFSPGVKPRTAIQSESYIVAANTRDFIETFSQLTSEHLLQLLPGCADDSLGLVTPTLDAVRAQTVHPYDEITFLPLPVLPEIKGGMTRLYEFIADNSCYPSAMLKSHQEGDVLLEFVLDEEGILSYATARSQQPAGCGFGFYALKAFSSMSFSPAEDAGNKVPLRMYQAVEFRLEK